MYTSHTLVSYNIITPYNTERKFALSACTLAGNFVIVYNPFCQSHNFEWCFIHTSPPTHLHTHIKAKPTVRLKWLSDAQASQSWFRLYNNSCFAQLLYALCVCMWVCMCAPIVCVRYLQDQILQPFTSPALKDLPVQGPSTWVVHWATYIIVVC